MLYIWTQLNVSNKILLASFLIDQNTNAKLYWLSEGLGRNSNYNIILRWNMVLAGRSESSYKPNSPYAFSLRQDGSSHRQRNFDWTSGFLDYRESTQSLLKIQESLLVFSTSVRVVHVSAPCSALSLPIQSIEGFIS